MAFETGAESMTAESVEWVTFQLTYSRRNNGTSGTRAGRLRSRASTTRDANTAATSPPTPDLTGQDEAGRSGT